MSHVTNEGVDLYYEVHGDGEETIVLAHGMGGNAAIWFNQVAHTMHRAIGSLPLITDTLRALLVPLTILNRRCLRPTL
jgi:pimeloyl-ACP methyl ester carboxylesterase